MAQTLGLLPQPPRANADHAEVRTWARRLMIALPIALGRIQTSATATPFAPTFPTYIVTNRTIDRAYDADITDIDELADVLGTMIFDVSSGLGFGTYTISNILTDRSYDANSTSLDEMADVLGTVADDLSTNNTIDPYTILNANTDRVYNANSTTEDKLADVLATFITDLQVAGLLG
jgi:hypothetical protein